MQGRFMSSAFLGNFRKADAAGKFGEHFHFSFSGTGQCPETWVPVTLKIERLECANPKERLLKMAS